MTTAFLTTATAPRVTTITASPANGVVGLGQSVVFTVTLDQAVIVAQGTPVLTLNDGGTATYTGGSGNAALTFRYTATAGQNTSDLAVTGIALNGASITASTSFALAPAASYPAGDTPEAVTAADVNGDGKPDLVVADFWGGISVLLNDGGGGFAPPTSYAAGSYTQSVAAADVNGDGKPDLVVTNFGSNTVSVLLNNGSGGFGTPVTYDGGSFPTSATVADVNGDGKPDLIVADFNGGLSVLLANGRGGFGAPTNYPAGLEPSGVAVADLDGDGKPDLIALNGYGDTVTVRLNNGSGTFKSAATYAAGPTPKAIVAADVNGDGRPDLIVADDQGGVSVLLNNGSGGFLTATSYAAGLNPAAVTTADMNGDGLPDIVAADRSGAVAVLLNNGSGGFLPASATSAGSALYAVATADVNGDGLPDVIAADNNGGVWVLTNTSSPVPLLAASIATAAGADTGLVVDTTDPVYAITAANANNAASSSGTIIETFTVTRTGTLSAVGSVTYTIAGNGAARGLMFANVLTGTVNFAVGAATATITVPIVKSWVGAAQTFTVTLSSVSGGGGIGTASATGTIAPNYAPGPHDVALHDRAGNYTVIADANGNGVITDLATGQDTQTVSGLQAMVFADGIGQFDKTGNAEEVARLYKAAFNRTSDLGGLDYWTGQLDAASLGLNDVARAFVSSAEFSNRYGILPDSNFVQQMYQNVLGRAGDSSGITYWTRRLATGTSRASILQSFSDSVENKTNTMATTGDKDMAEAYRLYQAAFNRTPDSSGLNYWTTQLDNGQTALQVAQGMSTSPEFTGLYNGTTNTAYVNTLYQNVLHRAGESGGVNYWTGLLNGGTSRQQVLLGFSDSQENRQGTAAATHDGWVLLPLG